MTSKQQVFAAGALAISVATAVILPLTFTRTAYLLATTRAQVGTLMLVQRTVDQALGYPIQNTLSDGGPAAGSFTLHHAGVQCAYVVPNECAMPVTAQSQTVLAAMVATCSGAVEAGALPDGGATPNFCAAAAQLTIVTVLPAAFSQWDGSSVPVWCDAGAQITACGDYVPPDDYAPDAGEDGGADSGAVTVDAGHEGGVVVLDASSHEGGTVVVTP